ncbi:hypothetical protein N7468_003793 [Penicillium chermesinum]|uniref:Transcription factor n=1 Tax=Penicillium chermesinum TaxID=63820 RepID=A0A9W9P7D0_9EURO|nr:uncharacterized protein N7468_003793 [Penicillium chermesinum]KAJ5239174.1 hypothetical protein N7468_003793 [Penicillium chermesinum]
MPSSTPDALESDLLTKLAATSALEELQETLLGSLHRAGWTERVTSLATELLRAHRCETFDDVLDAVNGGTSNGTTEGKANGTKKDGSTNAENAPYDPLKYIEEVDVRIPDTVVDEGGARLKKHTAGHGRSGR